LLPISTGDCDSWLAALTLANFQLREIPSSQFNVRYENTQKKFSSFDNFWDNFGKCQIVFVNARNRTFETFVLRQSCAVIFPSIYRVFIIVRKKTVHELHNLIIDTLYLVALDILL